MQQAAAVGLDERLPLEELREVFERSEVVLAVCFGSQASGKTHDDSDIDIAIKFDTLRPGDDSYNKQFFQLHRRVSDVLGTDDIDLLDVHSLSGSLARTVLTDGVLLYGDSDRVETLRDQLLDADSEGQSARERFDAVLERIDEHLA